MLFLVLRLRSLVMLQVSLQVKGIQFVESPSRIGSGIIYLPPEGNFHVSCSTDRSADITLLAVNSGSVYRPGHVSLNITQVSDKRIVLFAASEDFSTKGHLLAERKFVCHAEDGVNGKETRTRVFQFRLGGKSYFESQSENVTIAEKQEINLTCSVSLSVLPRPLVVWMHRRSPNASYINILKTTRIKAHSLHFTYILDLGGFRNNSGIYRCNSSNQFGYALSIPIAVNVTYFDVEKFRFFIKPRRPKAGNLVVFFLRVSANPQASTLTIIKTENGMVIASKVNSNDFDYTLIVNESLMGIYNATAVHLSEKYVKTQALTVQSSPRGVKFEVVDFSYYCFTYKWIVEFIGNSSIIDITICCTEQYDTHRSSTCLKGVSKTTLVYLSPANDTLCGLNPTVVHYCQVFAANAVGSGKSNTIVVPTVPSKPTVTCQICRETSIIVKWAVKFTGGDNILYYNVRYRSAASENTQGCFPYKVFPSGGSCQLTGLVENTQYFIEVTAKNRIGSSLPGRTTCNTTCIINVNFLNAHQVLQIGVEKEVVLKFNLFSSGCGNVNQYDVKRCGEKSKLDSSTFALSTTLFWMGIRGLSSADKCITVTVTTNEGFVSASNFNIKLRDNLDAVKKRAVVLSLASFFLCIACVGCGIIKYRKEKVATRSASAEEGQTSGGEKKKADLSFLKYEKSRLLARRRFEQTDFTKPTDISRLCREHQRNPRKGKKEDRYEL